MSVITKPCIGSINKESVASQEDDWGIMDILTARPSVKVRALICFRHSFLRQVPETVNQYHNSEFLFVHNKI
jgi:hypothetical protein